MLTPISNIFIVDDDPLYLVMLEHFLKGIGHEKVTPFTNGPDCIKQLQQHPDIIFLDYAMYPMDGIDTLKVIKSLYQDICVIFLSGQNDTEVAVDALKCGAYDYISKGSEQFMHIKAVIKKVERLRREGNEEVKNFAVDNRWYNGAIQKYHPSFFILNR